MAGHTPGPWVQDRYGSLVGSDSKQVVVWGLGIAHGQRNATAEANARLIAAAPELLEALKSIVGWIEEGGYGAEATIERCARAAMAKAEGK
jgi:hypothetical protein